VREGENYWASFDIYIGNNPHVTPGAPLPEDIDQMAPRIQKALQHAVDLCRGTFNAPAQSKQPF
jgi:hypothetical protein